LHVNALLTHLHTAAECILLSVVDHAGSRCVGTAVRKQRRQSIEIY